MDDSSRMAEFSEQQSKMVKFSEQRDKMGHHSRALKQQIQSAFHHGLMQLHSQEQQLLNMVDELTSQQEAVLLKKSLQPEIEAEEAKDADMAEEEVKDQEVEMLEKPEKEQQPENSEDQGEKEEGTEQKDRQSTWLPLSVSVPALKIDAKQLEDAIHDFATLQSGAMDLESSDFCQDSMMSDDTHTVGDSASLLTYGDESEKFELLSSPEESSVEVIYSRNHMDSCGCTSLPTLDIESLHLMDCVSQPRTGHAGHVVDAVHPLAYSRDAWLLKDCGTEGPPGGVHEDTNKTPSLPGVAPAPFSDNSNWLLRQVCRANEPCQTPADCVSPADCAALISQLSFHASETSRWLLGSDLEKARWLSQGTGDKFGQARTSPDKNTIWLSCDGVGTSHLEEEKAQWEDEKTTWLLAADHKTTGSTVFGGEMGVVDVYARAKMTAGTAPQIFADNKTTSNEEEHRLLSTETSTCQRPAFDLFKNWAAGEDTSFSPGNQGCAEVRNDQLAADLFAPFRNMTKNTSWLV